MSKEIKVKENKSLALDKTYDVAEPKQAVQMAVVLKNIVVNQKLYSDIKGKNYAHVEGWMLAGMLTGISVVVEEPKDLSKAGELKYSCTAKLYQGEKVVGVGYALCSNKESSKTKFDEYAILSMAQTRAIGKAYRNKIGFIMKLAGFQATPAEEMAKVGETLSEPPSTVFEPTIDHSVPQQLQKGQILDADGKPAWACSKCGDPISDTVASYSLKTHGKRLCREHQPKK